MNILSVYAHHEPGSLTGALKNTALGELARQGHTILETDLYASGFSPKAEKFDFNLLSGQHFNYMLEQRYATNHSMAYASDILAEIEKLQKSDLVIFHTPIWWQGVPAVLKGWFDRVLAMGVAWDGGLIYEKGLLRGKKAFVCAVVGGPEEYYRADGRHKATFEQIMHPIHHGTLAFCGFDVIKPFVVYNTLGLGEAARAQTITNYQTTIANLLKQPAYLHKFD